MLSYIYTESTQSTGIKQLNITAELLIRYFDMTFQSHGLDKAL